MVWVRVARAASAHPAHRISQDEAAAMVGELSGASRRAAALARGSHIAQRQTTLSAEELVALPGSIQARNAVYIAEAPRLCLTAARKALGERPARDIAFVATSSCTGYHLPGLSTALAHGLGLEPTAGRLPITEAGCAGGVVAMTAVADHLAMRGQGVGLAAAVELCCLAFRPGDDDSTLTANLIFGDGAGAAVLETGPGPGIEIVESASYLAPASTGDLGFELTDGGFRPVLGRELPEVVIPALERAAGALLARHGLSPGDVPTWLLHPGGARILRGIEARLDLAPAATCASWESLHAHGNTSSAAIFDVLARYFDSPAAAGSLVLIAAFGPGVSVNLILGRQR